MIPEVIKTFAITCQQAIPNSGSSLLSFPSWYEYLNCVKDPSTHQYTPSLTGINDIWLIVAAVINILLRLAAIVAVVIIIYGGVQYITSQGSPERTDQARKTIIAAVIGLTIAVSASVIIGFIAGKLD